MVKRYKGAVVMKNSQLSKILTLLLVLVFVFAMAVPTFAAKTVKVKVEIGGSDGKLYVRLTAPADSDIATMSAPLNFDTSKLDYSEVSYLTNDLVKSYTGEEKTDDGIVLANTAIATSLTKESKIFTYVFDVKEDADGDVDFSFGDIVATDSNNDPINIVIHGDLTASLDGLEPLSADAIDDLGEDVIEDITEETEEESFEEESEEATNADFSASDSSSSSTSNTSNSVPNTARKVIAASVFGAVAVAAAAGTGIAIVRKKKSED